MSVTWSCSKQGLDITNDQRGTYSVRGWRTWPRGRGGRPRGPGLVRPHQPPSAAGGGAAAQDVRLLPPSTPQAGACWWLPTVSLLRTPGLYLLLSVVIRVQPTHPRPVFDENNYIYDVRLFNTDKFQLLCCRRSPETKTRTEHKTNIILLWIKNIKDQEVLMSDGFTFSKHNTANIAFSKIIAGWILRKKKMILPMALILSTLEYGCVSITFQGRRSCRVLKYAKAIQSPHCQKSGLLGTTEIIALFSGK